MNAERVPLLIPLPGSERQTERLALILGDVGKASVRRFPDGETYVRIDTSPDGRDVVLVAALDHPDEKFLSLTLLADTARDLGARQVGLVAPYLAYLRQDRRFHDGEGVTARYFAATLARHVDWLVTVDPHLHRIASLADIYPIRTAVVHSAEALGRWIASTVRDPVIVGPDAESAQWATAMGAAAGAPVIVARKTRRSDTDVSITVPDASRYHTHTPVIVDDIISTGRTMIETIKHLREVGLAAPVCVAVHAIFAGGALAALRDAGASRVATTNTVTHESNAIDVLPLIGPVSSALMRA